jgi:hypothetical protein
VGKPGVVLTEDKIKEKLGKPGFLKPIYEHNLGFPLPCSDTAKNEERERNLCRPYTLQRDSKVLLMPNYDDLYNDMITAVEDEELTSIKLLSYVYDRMGFEDPSLTFYIGNIEGAVENEPKVFGWDFVMIGSKYKNHLNINRCNCEAGREDIDSFIVGKKSDYLRAPYIFLIDTVIGLKQFAGEIIKSPISFLEAELFENMIMEGKIPFYKLDGFRAAGEDWKNGITALTYRHRVDGGQGVMETTQHLLGEIPIIGAAFDQRYKMDSRVVNKLFLTRGIYGGDDYSQNMALWVHYLKNPPEGKCLPNQPGGATQEETDRGDTNISFVKVIPYRYGSGVDIFWSLLNISHGYAYEMASEIVSRCDVHPGNAVALSGHSGGVQRSIETARILNDDGIKVEKIHGIAGPARGYVPCEKMRIVLNSEFWSDLVSDISRLVKYMFLSFSASNIDWDTDDREARLKDGEYYKHKAPGFVDGKTRLKYDGFLYDNYEYLLK